MVLNTNNRGIKHQNYWYLTPIIEVINTNTIRTYIPVGEYFSYRFETIREKALLELLAEKDATIQKMEIQLETLKGMIKK